MAIPLSASREKGQGRLCVYLTEQGSPTQVCSKNSTTCGAASEIQFLLNLVQSQLMMIEISLPSHGSASFIIIYNQSAANWLLFIRLHVKQLSGSGWLVTPGPGVGLRRTTWSQMTVLAVGMHWFDTINKVTGSRWKPPSLQTQLQISHRFPECLCFPDHSLVSGVGLEL